MLPLALIRILIALMVSSIIGATAKAGDYDQIAKDITRAAAQHNKKRIAILPFQNLVSRNETAGMVISERLTGQIIDRGQLEVIERTLLQGVLQEQRLGYSGILNPHTIRELGKVLGVDAVVTGTIVDLSNGRVEVHARMIDSESAKVLSASLAKVDKDWSESAFDNFNPMDVPVPALGMFEGTAYAAAPRMTDSLSNISPECESALRRHDESEKSMVDLKARYWALKLRDPGFSQESLSRNPGSEIRDAETRDKFYSSLRAYDGQKSVPELSMEEAKKLAEYETKSRVLSQECNDAF